MIRKLTNKSIDEAYAIVKCVIEKMINDQIFQWDDVYPGWDVINNDIRNGHAFGYFDKKDLCGFVILNEDIPSEYKKLNWTNPGKKALIVHRLSVTPNYQGKGIGKILMRYSEEYAHKNGYLSIRLDTFFGNPITLNLYKSLGYKMVGIVEFRKGLFYCYEKIMEK